MQSISSILLLFLTNSAAAYLVPNPPGKYNVTLTNGPLVDHNRIDPTTGRPRTLMLSVFEPAKCEHTVGVEYMPNKTAEYQGEFLKEVFDIPLDLSPLFLEARLPVCPKHHTCSFLEDAPILLFSPGYTAPRGYYNHLASAVASEGFVVISIDHPEDADIVTYPNGQAVYNNDTVQTNASIAAHLPPRLVDTTFVLDQLSNATAMAKMLPHRGHRRFQTDRVAMFGHSLGGVTSVFAAAQDKRIRGACNWDGTFYPQLPSSGVSQPVLLVSHGFADDTWPPAYQLLNGPKLWINVANTTHESFSDVPSMLQAAGKNITLFSTLIGTISPAETVKIVTTYTAEWMRGVFAGKETDPLFQEQNPEEFPEVVIVDKANY